MKGNQWLITITARWWFQTSFYFHPYLGQMIQFNHQLVLFFFEGLEVFVEHFTRVGLAKVRSECAFESDMIYEQPGVFTSAFTIRFMVKIPVPWDIWELYFKEVLCHYVLKKKNTRSLEVQVVVSYAKNQLSYALGICVHVVYNSIHHGPPTCLVVFMVNDLVFRLSKPVVSWVGGLMASRSFHIYMYECLHNPRLDLSIIWVALFLFVSKSRDHFWASK